MVGDISVADGLCFHDVLSPSMDHPCNNTSGTRSFGSRLRQRSTPDLRREVNLSEVSGLQVVLEESETEVEVGRVACR